MLIDKLFESPDNIKINGITHKWDDGTSKFTFGYLGGDFCGEFDITHPVLCEIYDAVGYDKQDMDYPGRVWIEYKIITFWEYPENLDKLKKIVEDIERKTKFKIWDNGYKIEIVISGEIEGKNKWPKNVQTELVNIENYDGSNKWSPIIKQYGHGNEKNKESFGSVKYAKDKPLNYRQHLQTESINQHFSRDENSSQDKKINNLGIGKINLIKKWLEDKSIEHYKIESDNSVTVLSPEYNCQINLELEKPTFIKFNYVDKDDELIIKCGINDIDRVKELMANGASFSDFPTTTFSSIVKNNAGDVAVFIHDYYPEKMDVQLKTRDKFLELVYKTKNQNISESFERKDDKFDSLNIGKLSLIKKWLEENKINSYIVENDFSVTIEHINISDFANLVKNLPSYIVFNYANNDEAISIYSINDDLEKVKSLIKSGTQVYRWPSTTINYMIKYNAFNVAKYIYDHYDTKGNISNLLRSYLEKFINVENKIDESFLRNKEDKLDTLGIGKSALIKEYIEKLKSEVVWDLISKYDYTGNIYVYELWSISPILELEETKPSYINIIYGNDAELCVAIGTNDVVRAKKAIESDSSARPFSTFLLNKIIDNDWYEMAEFILENPKIVQTFENDKWDNFIKYYKKRNVNESFSKNSNDKINTLGIGKIAKIKEWLEEHEGPQYYLTKDNKIFYTGVDYPKQALIQETAPSYIEFEYPPSTKLFVFTILHDIDKVKEAYEEGFDIDDMPNNLWKFTYQYNFKEGLELLRKFPNFREILVSSFKRAYDNYFEQIDNEDKLDESFNLQGIKEFISKISDKSKTITSLIEKYNTSSDKQIRLFIIKVLIVLLTAINSADISTLLVNASDEILHLLSKDKISVNDFKGKNVSKFKNPLHLKLSQEGINFIKDHEKLRLKAYKIGDGKITVGWGCAFPINKSKIRPGQRITFDQAEKLLSARLKVAEDGVKRMFSDWADDGHLHKISQSMFDSMVSMMFNMGVSGFRNLSLSDDLKNGDFHKAAEKIPTSNLVDGMGGIVKRRKDEQKLFIKDIKDYKMK